jgi:hypothetical protein
MRPWLEASTLLYRIHDVETYLSSSRLPRMGS